MQGGPSKKTSAQQDEARTSSPRQCANQMANIPAARSKLGRNGMRPLTTGNGRRSAQCDGRREHFVTSKLLAKKAKKTAKENHTSKPATQPPRRRASECRREASPQDPCALTARPRWCHTPSAPMPGRRRLPHTGPRPARQRRLHLAHRLQDAVEARIDLAAAQDVGRDQPTPQVPPMAINGRRQDLALGHAHHDHTLASARVTLCTDLTTPQDQQIRFFVTGHVVHARNVSPRRERIALCLRRQVQC